MDLLDKDNEEITPVVITYVFLLHQQRLRDLQESCPLLQVRMMVTN